MNRAEMMFEAVKLATYNLVSATTAAIVDGMSPEEVDHQILKTHRGKRTATEEFKSAYDKLDGQGE